MKSKKYEFNRISFSKKIAGAISYAPEAKYDLLNMDKDYLADNLGDNSQEFADKIRG